MGRREARGAVSGVVSGDGETRGGEGGWMERGREGGREGRVETERKSFEDSTSRERQLG